MAVAISGFRSLIPRCRWSHRLCGSWALKWVRPLCRPAQYFVLTGCLTRHL